MRERPILFSGPMVQALLAGRKTQTRRVIRKPAGASDRAFSEAMTEAARQGWAGAQKRGPEDGIEWRCGCPYGVAGDRLWVRETWAPSQRWMAAGDVGTHADVLWRASSSGAPDVLRGWSKDWRPSIFMPRWASRLTLDVEAVRVERLGAITDADIQAEGIEYHPAVKDLVKAPCAGGVVRLVEWVDAWRKGWNAINGKRPGCRWEDNPWVWVVSFRVAS